MNKRDMLKQTLTIVAHPILSVDLLKKGSRNFRIKTGLSINKLKYLTVGENVQIGTDARILFVEEYYGGTYEPGLDIGSHISIGNRFTALSAAKITIEDYCLLASDILITSENHGNNPEDAPSYAYTPLSADEVTIGKGTWIGEKVSIMPGVTLGERCIVAANAVVSRSFPAGSLIGGVPAKLIKRYNYDTHKWEKPTEADK